MVNPAYRNNRRNYYQEKGPDTVTIGTVVNVFKTKQNSNSYDSNFVPSTLPINGVTAYTDLSGNGQPEANPEYQYYGYLYCDGTEYNIIDYPLLYEQIGNEFGGTASNGIDITNGGSNYDSGTDVTFSAPQLSNGVVATGVAVVESGVITAINLTFAGSGYTSAPTITLSNTGSGAGFAADVRIDEFGQIAAINPTNVMRFWPDPQMGTFKVPDLLAKKIVGVGPVYGPGTPTIANVDSTVGNTGGQWYFDKNSQKAFFNLGNVRTTGYTSVVGTTNGRITGSQTITVTLNDNDLDGPPVHSHLLYHSEAPQVQGFPGSSVQIDPFMTGYRTRTGRISPFNPSGNIKLTHSHALSKERLTGLSTLATYDVYNWQGGDSGPGTLKDNGNYYASGNSGTFVTVTYTPFPLHKKFSSGSLIGGREVITEGTPVYNYEDTTFNSAGTYPYSLDVNVDEIQIFAYGASGSGGVYTQAGNAGGDTVVQLGDGSPLTLTVGGGLGGNAATESSQGNGGAGGTSTVTGTYASQFSVSQQSLSTDVDYVGGPGVNNKQWFAVNPDGPPTDPVTGRNLWEGRPGLNASAGKYLTVAASARGSIQSVTYPQTASWSITPTDPNKYTVVSGIVKIYGSRGNNCQNQGAGTGTAPAGCTTGFGGNGKYMELSIVPDSNTGQVGGVFGLYPGAGSGATTYGVATGGPGGSGHTQNGGAGGGGSIVTTTSGGGTTVIVAGCGGGGGGGGAGEGQCGDNGRPNNITDGAQNVGSQSLFSGSGGPGGNYGCTGGGGGGGGSGVGKAGQTGSAGGGSDGAGGGGGDGGGGGGSGGHGGGYGGGRGLSSFRSDFFTLNSSGDVNHGTTNDGSGSGTNDGKIIGYANENRGYYSSGAGGGGGGAYLAGTIFPEAVTASGSSALTITIGAGGASVSNSLNRTVDSSINWVENSGTITSDAGSDGSILIREATIVAYQGGSTNITVGDVVVAASDGIEIYAGGTGVGTAGGFALPTNQQPILDIQAQGDQPGSGATGVATISGGVVNGVSLITGGSGYTSPPIIRFLHGAASGSQATSTLNGDNVNGLALGNGGTAYTNYVKFGGTELERFIVITATDCTNIKKFGVKAARGNNINGGERPDDSADELRVYYNTDNSLNFPESNFLGVLVPRPSDAEIASDYDGNGSGPVPTKWYSYFIDLPSGAQVPGVRFKIVQQRNTAAGTNDNGGNTDHYGIIDFIYESKFINQTQFQSSAGELSGDARTVTYTVEGDNGAQYPAGIDPDDVTLNLTAGTPLVPTAYLDPQDPIPLLEPYALTKHLIKAF
jgi:hypothetical protein